MVDTYIASDPRFTPPGLAPGPGMSGRGPGYFGGGSEPVPFGTSPSPYEPPVGIFIGDELYPLGFKFNYGAPPYSSPAPPQGEPGQSGGWSWGNYRLPEFNGYSGYSPLYNPYVYYSSHSEYEPQETD